MANKKEIVEAFLEWYPNDPHASYEDYYLDTITADNLNSLSKGNFIAFFVEFARNGGMVQSGGQRTAPSFEQNISEKYEEFRTKILEPFDQVFDPEKWLIWADNFNDFGQGLATIYLNRVDKHKFVIVNEKVIQALPNLGFDKLKGANLSKKYNQILQAEQSLLNEFPVLNNFFKLDTLMHFLIGTEDGKKFIDLSNSMTYFDFEGMRNYAIKAGTTYTSKDPAAVWYYDTREKLYNLVALLSSKLSLPLTITYKEQPNAQAGRGKIVFKEYVLVGFAPNGLFPEGMLFIKIAIHDLKNTPYLSLEIDINDKAENNPFKKSRYEFLEKTGTMIPIDDTFPKNWDSLVDRTQNIVEQLVVEFSKIANIKLENRMPQLFDKNQSINTILYGPPGTGKTYSTIDYALAIVENKTREAIALERKGNPDGVKRRYDAYVDSNRIAFCTFHQSMGYEDFIEGIKPLPPVEDKPMQYAVVDGIFKRLCTAAIFELASKEKSQSAEKTLDFSQAYDQFVSDMQEQLSKEDPIKLETVSGGQIVVEGVSDRNNLIVKHRGSEKTYIVSKDRLTKLSRNIADLKIVSNIDAKFREVIGGSNATAYWAVLNKIRSQTPVNLSKERDFTNFKYDEKKGAVENFRLTKYDQDDAAKADHFVLIIDEINRGNISQIFGELITLVEDDKRMGKLTTLSATLPYSGDIFSVPPNLHIIGTMNTADRSVEALDTALRRRFSFVHMKPEPNKLEVTQEGINLGEMLTRINKRLEVLLDADHTIGHAWLWEVNDLTKLRQVFKDKILPLLQEFFYNDYEKIGLVLGDAFVRSEKVDTKVFAEFSKGSGLANEYTTANLYYLNDVMQISAEQFSAI